MKLYEKKDNLIKKNPNLTEEQKQEIIALLARHPSSENLIDWNRNSKLTYEDFLTVLRPLYINDLDFKGLVKGEDYDLLLDKPNEKLYAVYTYEASKILASNSVEPKIWTEIPEWCGEEEFTDKAHAFGHFDSKHGNMKPGAKWCISMQTSDKYWEDYNKDFAFLFWFRNEVPVLERKIAIVLDKNDEGNVSEIYKSDDTPYFEYPKYIDDIIGELDLEIFKKKASEALFKKFVLNKETGRYDYDGDLYSSTLKNFISEDWDGFAINFGKVTGDFDCSHLYIDSLKGCPTEVGGTFNCSSTNIKSLKYSPQKVDADFFCLENKLTSLEGAPKKVGGTFSCRMNNLSTLEGAPKEVGSMLCGSNPLTSLKGSPSIVHGNFNCDDCGDLISLEGAPDVVGGTFSCDNNTSLKSLKGAPKKVGKTFSCDNCSLTSLEGAPKEVGEAFDCGWNFLTDLKGSPEIVNGNFYCNNNDLTSLEGAPKEVWGLFYCSSNKYLDGVESFKGLNYVGNGIYTDSGRFNNTYELLELLY